ncbi:3-phosphoshikimate 1-carboxyvinyltransferase [bacterium]|nr:3-phosphoshikimate 1-carboxyvinyltransferase [bacterium]
MKTINLPPDKSISHRAAVLGSVFDGKVTIKNFSTCEDCLSTLACLKKLGVKFSLKNSTLTIFGKGLYGLNKPSEPLDCGNSGTTMRFLAGILAPQKFDCELVGDFSLSERPMKRVVEPLQKMGAKIELSTNGTAPIKIFGSELKPISYKMDVESAQVKSAILLASLYSGKSKISHKTNFRNHTELLLEDFFVNSKTWDIFVPNDFSAAAFWIVFGLANTSNISIKLENVGLNPTRTAFLEIVLKMGAKIKIKNQKYFGKELVCDLQIFPSKTQNVKIPKNLISNLIDEIPILSVLGIFSKGKFTLKNASELRFKEVDRIQALIEIFETLELDFKEFEDGFYFFPKQVLLQKTFPKSEDHRIVMAQAIFSLLTKNQIKTTNFAATKISFPNFLVEFEKILKIL